MNTTEFEYFVLSAIAAITLAAAKTENVVTFYEIGYNPELEETTYIVQDGNGKQLGDVVGMYEYNIEMLNKAMAKTEGVTVLAA